jgi:hypothetical protein
MQMATKMKSTLVCSAVLLALAVPLVSSASMPQVAVRFESPIALANAGIDANERANRIEQMENAFSRALTRRARGCLPQDQRVEISITDFDAAGTAVDIGVPSRREIPVVKNGWSASTSFQYRLYAGQGLLRSGSQHLRASGFVGDDPTARIRPDSFGREQSMVIEWFETTFCAPDASK